MDLTVRRDPGTPRIRLNPVHRREAKPRPDVEEPDKPADQPRPTCDQGHRAPSRRIKNRGGGSRLSRAKRIGEELVVAFVDVDQLEAVNDHGVMRLVTGSCNAVYRDARVVVSERSPLPLPSISLVLRRGVGDLVGLNYEQHSHGTRPRFP